MIIHRFSAYDPRTKRLAMDLDIPDSKLESAKILARVPDDDPDVVMCYDLSPSEAKKLGDLLGVTVDLNQYEYFLEGFSV